MFCMLRARSCFNLRVFFAFLFLQEHTNVKIPAHHNKDCVFMWPSQRCETWNHASSSWTSSLSSQFLTLIFSFCRNTDVMKGDTSTNWIQHIVYCNIHLLYIQVHSFSACLRIFHPKCVPFSFFWWCKFWNVFFPNEDTFFIWKTKSHLNRSPRWLILFSLFFYNMYSYNKLTD